MNRRGFVKNLGTGLLVAAAPAIVTSKGKFVGGFEPRGTTGEIGDRGHMDPVGMKGPIGSPGPRMLTDEDYAELIKRYPRNIGEKGDISWVSDDYKEQYPDPRWGYAIERIEPKTYQKQYINGAVKIREGDGPWVRLK